MGIFTTEFLYEIVNFRLLGMSAILNDEMRWSKMGGGWVSKMEPHRGGKGGLWKGSFAIS